MFEAQNIKYEYQGMPSGLPGICFLIKFQIRLFFFYKNFWAHFTPHYAFETAVGMSEVCVS